MNLLDSCIHMKYMKIDLESLSESIRQVVKALQLATTIDEVISDLANISITESKGMYSLNSCICQLIIQNAYHKTRCTCPYWCHKSR